MGVNRMALDSQNTLIINQPPKATSKAGVKRKITKSPVSSIVSMQIQEIA